MLRKDHGAANPGYYRSLARLYKARRKKAQPAWLSADQKKEIFRIYAERPKGHEVDHIVPLRGKEVCGLHVPWNLQYLSKKDNCIKSNAQTNTTRVGEMAEPSP